MTPAAKRTAVLSAVFFLSGASALLFEVLWFRQAGLTFGNGVWASSVVLASFMAGLALGNGLAARFGDAVLRPLRLYATAEIAIGAVGFSIVVLLPALAGPTAPLFSALGERPFLLNAVRLAIAFFLMLVPTAAMGATLPLLVRASTPFDPFFGRVLGRLYGWNTLGAVVGAVVGEGFLVRALGVRGTGAFAAAIDLSIAAVALSLASRDRRAGLAAEVAASPSGGVTPGRVPLLAAAFLSGGLLLALEVVWFRFLLLFVIGTHMAFAVMLGAVLLGIALGGLCVSVLSKRAHRPEQGITAVLLAAGAAVVATYGGISSVVTAVSPVLVESPTQVAALALYLVLPTSFASGVAFTLLGVALRGEDGPEARTTGHLTLFNTLGGMAGSIAAGFVLLPLVGVERSLFVLALGYGVASLLAFRRGLSRGGVLGTAASAAVFAAMLVLFPFGRMRSDHLERVIERFGDPQTLHVAAWREGLTETILYLEDRLLGEPLTERLVTNGFSMSASTFWANRYMKLFVYLPVALHPEPKKALLVSYGVGSTAKALTDTASLQRIDMVDISRDVLELSRVVFPREADNPTRDPRTRLHVEDGRFFLQTTNERYDVITGEPPPPQCAGVVNLYTREYFRLIRDRLASGGITSYWLPTHSLEKGDALAILRGFCDVFPSCSLWDGAGTDWVMLGFKDVPQRADAGHVGRLWRDPVVAAELRRLGFESPELMGATFLGDGAFLDDLTRSTPPLVDDRPKRLLARPRRASDAGFFEALRDPRRAMARFDRSAFAAHVWPAELKDATSRAFQEQEAVERAITGRGTSPPEVFFSDLDLVLTKTTLETPVLWMLGTEARAVEIARRAETRGLGGPAAEAILAAADVSHRDYATAERRYSALSGSDDVDALRIFLLALEGDRDRAAALANEARARGPKAPFTAAYFGFLKERFGIRLRFDP